MKQMQEQMAGGGMATQMAAMQHTMYGMMQVGVVWWGVRGVSQSGVTKLNG